MYVTCVVTIRARVLKQTTRQLSLWSVSGGYRKSLCAVHSVRTVYSATMINNIDELRTEVNSIEKVLCLGRHEKFHLRSSTENYCFKNMLFSSCVQIQ